MKKTFCDICEQPAEEMTRAEIKYPIGKPHVATRNSDIMKGPQLIQCQVVVRPVITLEDHPTGFGGPPDLCRKCLCKLLNDLRVKFEAGHGMATYVSEK